MKNFFRKCNPVRALVLLGAALVLQPSFADIVPISAETRLSLPTTGSQSYSRVASDAAGNYVVVYYSNDGDNDSSFFQRYSADGTFLGGYQFNGLQVSDVAMNSNGTSVAVFYAPSANDPDDIYIQIFDSAGNPLFAGLPRLNAYTSGHQADPSVAINDAGDIIVAWTSYQLGANPNAQTAYARQLDSLGYFISPEIKITGPFSYSTQKSSVETAIDAAGNFVLVWTDWYYPNRNPMDIYARRYSRGGGAIGNPFRANTLSTDLQHTPRMAMHQDTGEFAMTWHSWDPSTSAWQLRFRRFSATGVKLGSERQIDDNVTTRRPFGDIAMNGNGIAVVWGDAGVDRDVYMRTFNLDGTDRSPTTRINTFTDSIQKLPSVTWLPNLEVVATWYNYREDGGVSGIYSAHFLDL